MNENNVYYYEDYRNQKEKSSEDSYNDYNDYNYNHSSFVRRDKNVNGNESNAAYSNENYQSNFNKVKNVSKQTLIIMQMFSCAIIIAAVLIFKSFFPQYYNVFCDWYNNEINKSIIAGEGTQNYEVIEEAPQSIAPTDSSASAVSVNNKISDESAARIFYI